MGEACLVEGCAAANPSCVYSPEWDLAVEWFAVRVRVGGELRVAEHLKTRNFEIYCPFRWERCHYADRIKEKKAAVFPGYLFARFALSDKVKLISCPGVDYIVGFAGMPVPIPYSELLGIQKAIANGATITNQLIRGQRVRVVRGPLAGVEGTFVRDNDRGQFSVSIELLSQSATLQVAYSDLAALDSPA